MRTNGDDDVELGLTLGAQNYCRILTAKDFPGPSRDFAGPSRASPSPSPSDSSVSSSSPALPTVRTSPQTTNNQVVVGWPPVRTFRMNSLFNLSKLDASSSDISKKPANGNTPPVSQSSQFLKVNMDGDPIGRKVDLNSYDSYQSLASSLEVMFNAPTSAGLLDNSSDFVLTYKDKDGDWLLVGDVPWNMFLDAAKRLRIMRNSDANRLASRFQS